MTHPPSLPPVAPADAVRTAALSIVRAVADADPETQDVAASILLSALPTTGPLDPAAAWLVHGVDLYVTDGDTVWLLTPDGAVWDASES